MESITPGGLENSMNGSPIFHEDGGYKTDCSEMFLSASKTSDFSGASSNFNLSLGDSTASEGSLFQSDSSWVDIANTTDAVATSLTFGETVRRETEQASPCTNTKSVTFLRQHKSHVTIGPKLGNGTFGAAYLAKNVQTGEDKVLKYNFTLREKLVLSNRHSIYCSDEGNVKTPGEVYALTMNHPNLLPVDGIVTANTQECQYWDKENLNLSKMIGSELRLSVSPFVDGYDGGCFRSVGERLFQTLYQIADGLSYLHDNDFIHGDLKPDNIFFDQKGDVKIGDLASLEPLMGTTHLSGGVFADGYGAPEVYSKSGKRDQKADAFALGITACEIALGKHISTSFERRFWHHSMQEQTRTNFEESFLENHLTQADKETLDRKYLGLRPLLEQLTMVNPYKRISAQQFREEIGKLK